MGFFSNLFGAKQQDNALEDAFRLIDKIINDEQYQIDLVPALKPIVANLRHCDYVQDGHGPFGYCKENPIPVNGPYGEIAYLSRIETLNGERILFHRFGSISSIDVFECVTLSGSAWYLLYLDLYHPSKSKATPDEFRFTKEKPLFSGFHQHCKDFPYDFINQKVNMQGSGLSIAYIPISKIKNHIDSNAYQRPESHTKRLIELKKNLTSFQYQ